MFYHGLKGSQTPQRTIVAIIPKIIAHKWRLKLHGGINKWYILIGGTNFKQFGQVDLVLVNDHVNISGTSL
jgi:hypothetical protein